MRREAIDRVPGSGCAPSRGEDGPGQARARGFAGLPLPRMRLTALLALGIVGPFWLSDDEPAREPPHMRMVPGRRETVTVRLALSPDGRTIATAHADGRLSLRDIRDEGGGQRYLDHAGGALVSAFSLDGRSLALGRDQAGIMIFDVATRRPLTTLDVPLSRLWCLAFSPDGRTLAAGTSKHGEIVLWDLIAGRPSAKLRGDFPAVSLAFSPDGWTLAVGERDGMEIPIWDLRTGRSRPIRREKSGPIPSVAFSPDGGLLAAAAPWFRPVRIWDAESGRLRMQVEGHEGGSSSVRFSPDGRLLATSGNDGMVRIWRAADGQQLASLDGRSPSLFQVAFSADGTILVAAGMDDHVRVWHMADLAAAGSARPRK
jgi:WD40 repeat protein